MSIDRVGSLLIRLARGRARLSQDRFGYYIKGLSHGFCQITSSVCYATTRHFAAADRPGGRLMSTAVSRWNAARAYNAKTETTAVI